MALTQKIKDSFEKYYQVSLDELSRIDTYEFLFIAKNKPHIRSVKRINRKSVEEIDYRNRQILSTW